jgi:hypothetical protein
MFPQEEDHKSEDQRQTDGQGKWNDGHGATGQFFPPVVLRAGFAISIAC